MTEGYTDEELAAGVSWDPMKHGLQGLNELGLRLGATIQRLLRERNQWQQLCQNADRVLDENCERADKAERERDEARRVGSGLEGLLAQIAEVEWGYGQDPCGRADELRRLLRAYKPKWLGEERP